MTENQDDKKPMDIVAEEKLQKWLESVGLSNEGDYASTERKGQKE